MAKKKRGRPAKKKEINIKSEETKIFVGILLVFASILCLLSPFLQGTVFTQLSRFMGIGALPAGLTLLMLGTSVAGYKFKFNDARTIIGLAMLTILVSTFAHFIIPEEETLEVAQNGDGGGLLGYAATTFLVETFGRFTSVILLSIVTLITFSLISGVTLEQIREFSSNLFSRAKEKNIEESKLSEDDMFIGGTKKLHTDTKEDAKEDAYIEESHVPTAAKAQEEEGQDMEKMADTLNEPATESEAIQYPNWKLPQVDILDAKKTPPPDPNQYRGKAELIEKTLKSFGIHAKVSEIAVGPRVVQYALSITVGTKVSKVKSLGNDLALALAAPSGSVRIEAPIPGTSLIGIEVPNDEPVMVQLGESLRSQEMTTFKGKLPVVLGKDISGRNILKDLTKMPHLLIAGATGSGKSVSINAILGGLLMNHSPDYVKFIMVDPKMVELPPYNDIPHLLTPVITDVEKVIYSLEWLVTEMQKRFRILNKSAKRNIQQYNESLGYPALPYIILIVDEMADLMLTAGVDVESKIVRLAQMARAVGIHLVLATQRPSVDVLTGLIKANIPARLGFNVATTVDSRVILDMTGAESLLGDGDMLFKAPDSSRPLRIQGAFVSGTEVEAITSFLKSQVDSVEYNKAVTKPKATTAGDKGAGSALSEDPLFADAVRTVVAAQKASSSLLQRKLRIGYNRAARLIDELHAAKVVGPQDGSKPRKVMISDAEMFLNQASSDEQE